MCYGGRNTLSNLNNADEKVIKKIENLKGASISTVTSPKVYLKAMPLRTLDDLDIIKHEVESGNILILKITPLATESVDDVKRAVGELCDFTQLIGGDIARLGEERVVVTPSSVRIWRKKTVSKDEKANAT